MLRLISILEKYRLRAKVESRDLFNFFQYCYSIGKFLGLSIVSNQKPLLLEAKLRPQYIGTFAQESQSDLLPLMRH